MNDLLFVAVIFAIVSLNYGYKLRVFLLFPKKTVFFFLLFCVTWIDILNLFSLTAASVPKCVVGDDDCVAKSLNHMIWNSNRKYPTINPLKNQF